MQCVGDNSHSAGRVNRAKRESGWLFCSRLGRYPRLGFFFSYSTLCVEPQGPRPSRLRCVLLNPADRTFETGPLPSMEPGFPGLRGERGPKGHQGLKGVKGDVVP